MVQVSINQRKQLPKDCSDALLSTRNITPCIFQVHMSNKKPGSHQGSSFKRQNTKSPLSTKIPLSSILLFVFSTLYYDSTEKISHCSNHTKKNLKSNKVHSQSYYRTHYFICNKFHITLSYYLNSRITLD